MSTILYPQSKLKRRVILAVLILTFVSATIATIVHRLQPNIYPLHLINPPLFAITSLILLIRLYRKPESLQQVINLGILQGVMFVVMPCWFYSLMAFSSSKISLVDNLPPISSISLMLMTFMLITVRPQRLFLATILLWIGVAGPILTYFIFNPEELYSLRGLDLLMSFGPVMRVQTAQIFLHNRLQSMVESLYVERLQYYAQITERQSIRQNALEQAFTQIHNGPLQTLALLQRDVQTQQISQTEFLQRLKELNTEIRAVGRSLTDKNHTINKQVISPETLESANSENFLRLGEGTSIDLNLPFHNLLHEVYSLTLKRNLPCFQTIRVKVRNFAPITQFCLTLDMKRDLCLWLEESLCNVGKHARGVTRIVVTGEKREGNYILKVQDNGCGLKPGKEQQGTKHSHLLAKRLGGEFRRESLPKGGVICELSWKVGQLPKSAMTNGQKLPSGLSVTVNDFSLKLNDTEIVETNK
ncbi:MAG: hypothetical protein F6K25_02860 [Okeania sp. SIO2G4]|uniref:hypothetical protein n=2 Tax=Okeania TaxID=1458928 RepID=UPI0013BFE1A1|nr:MULTISPECIES: hypothetical protein [unclassified Okeania]NEP71436.1 hypothetical protein [Okeania sp. SIO2G5]NEQ89739.1 hypothetical protein [Okeania sp. SIO2G4]